MLDHRAISAPRRRTAGGQSAEHDTLFADFQIKPISFIKLLIRIWAARSIEIL